MGSMEDSWRPVVKGESECNELVHVRVGVGDQSVVASNSKMFLMQPFERTFEVGN